MAKQTVQDSTVHMDGMEFRFCGEVKKYDQTVREYVIWQDNNPIDRFSIFRYGSAQQWCAWCADTTSAVKKDTRKKFAKAFPK